jgi:Zn-dependent peptidase ImmA (M78 family)
MSEQFGQRLKAARIMAGLSMDGLVGKLDGKLSKQAISKYENGLMMPDSGNLILLADALGVGLDYFFTEDTIELSAVNFRKKASLGKRTVESLKERIKDSVERYIQLETLLHIETKFSNPLGNMTVRNWEDIELAAKQLRKAWKIGMETEISHVIDLLEEHSVKILELDEDESFDGLSAFVGTIPVIILNSKAPADRKRLTALHEFGHLILSFAPQLDEKAKEKFCHSFGGAFLLPENVLVRELGKKRAEISPGELKELKEQYGISMQASMYRAKLHGIISEYAYENFSINISRRGWRKNEPGQYRMDETPHRFEQLLYRALAEDVISISKAAYLSRMPIDEIERRFSLSDETAAP